MKFSNPAGVRIGGRLPRRSVRTLVASATVMAFAVAVAPGASAQGSAGSATNGSTSGSINGGSIVPFTPPGSLYGIPSLSVAAATQLGGSVQLTSVLNTLAAAGSGEFARPGSSSGPTSPIATRDPGITSTSVVSVEPLHPGSTNPDDARAEVWTVTSESMQREVRVEVYRAPVGFDAPNVYFLDGVGSESPSGWSTGMGWGDPALRSQNVNVIVPTGAPASMWSDWVEDDDVLGPNNWETFLTDELPGLLDEGRPEVVAPLDHNGSWGVMGVSMGAASALHLTNRYPEMFDAAGGISGAYSTLDELGYQYARLTTDARGGDVTKMWGPRGSQEWREHDTTADPSGLAGKSVYLSAANGLVGSTELGYFGSDSMLLVDGHVLEKGSYESTRRLEAALATVPGVDLRLNYVSHGIHNWPVFVPEMRPAMEHVLSGLAPAVPNGKVARNRLAGDGAVADGSLGSAGSSGSSGSGLSAGSSGSAGLPSATGSDSSGS